MTAQRSKALQFLPLLLLPLFFVWHGFVENFGLVTAGEAAQILAGYWVEAAALYGLCWLLYRRVSPAFLFCFSLLLLFFFFGALHDGLKRLTGDIFLAHYTFLIPFLAIGIVALALGFRRVQAPIRPLTRFLSLLFTVLILVDVVGYITQSQQLKKQERADNAQFRPIRGPKPNVYLILSDEYAGDDALKQLYSFNNADFYDSLQHRGFALTPHSRSNYTFTEYSMASMLNMRYLDVARNTSPEDVARCLYWIRHSAVPAFFQKAGYRVETASIFDVLDQPRVIDNAFEFGGKKLISGQTLTQRLWRDLKYHLYEWHIFKGHGDPMKVDRMNKTLVDAANWILREPASGPRFVYMHLEMPHSPYYYKEDGTLNDIEPLRDKANGPLYVGYVQYTNRVILRLVDKILQTDNTDPLIIVMGDHGNRFHAGDVPRELLYSNLRALHAPAYLRAAFTEKVTNVNLFRSLLNAGFGQQLPLLEDSLVEVGEQLPY